MEVVVGMDYRDMGVGKIGPTFIKPIFCSVAKDQLVTAQTLVFECFKRESYTGRM